ncbi:MAG: type II secretion system protein [Acidobacteria bacterium]|nr:type II secretion system protein [Acidobacteriota bacterium]MBI3488664.1 type II secretion system protein [Acidobacteriota bacterium]
MSIHRTQRGFTMALALALAVVMGILLMKAGPSVVREVQRENEAELIFRGEAIASALRVYFAKTGKYPTDLDEVMKIRPRILRQKYKDPMTQDGEWEYITQVQPGASGNTKGLPIIGVRTLTNANGGNAFRLYQNTTLYHGWQFTAEQNLLGLSNQLNQGGTLKPGSSSDKPADKPAEKPVSKE